MKFWVSGVDLKKYSHTWQLRFFLFWRWCQKAVEIRRVRIGARVAELADALDLGTNPERAGGSIPSSRTKKYKRGANCALEKFL